MQINMQSEMTIGRKLLLSFGAAFGLTLLVSFAALYGFSSLGTAVQKLIGVQARKQYLAGVIKAAASDITAAERGILARSYMKDMATLEKYNQDFRESAGIIRNELEALGPLIETAEGRSSIQELQAIAGKIMQYHEDMYRMAASGKPEEASIVQKDKIVPLVQRAGQLSDGLVQQQQEMMASVGKTTHSSLTASTWLTLLIIVVSILVAVVVIFVVRGINRHLGSVVEELDKGAGQVASAAEQVASSSQSLAQGASEQAASIQETSASSEEINSMARKNTENSRAAADLVSQSQERFRETKQSLDLMVVAMGEINASSDKISKIIKVIDEIAFQTNILALNAAVEAARAGEAGMGFAVVADEVRNLAQRCAQAAQDTASLIEESISKSNDGKIKVDQVATAIHAIMDQSAGIKTLVDEVNVGSQEQARGIDQIGKAVLQMEQVTQKNAANAEEGASAAQELSAQSETLRSIVDGLSSLVGGAQHSRTIDRPPSSAGRE